MGNLTTRVIAIVSVAAVWFGCSPFDSDRQELRRERLETNRQKWMAQEIVNYDLRVRARCMVCSDDEVIVHVREGQPTVVVEAETQALEFFVRGPEVNDLFDQIERAVDQSAQRLSVTYDGDKGFPREIDIDVSPGVADDEFHSVVRSLIETAEAVPSLSDRVHLRREQWARAGVREYDFSLLREGAGVPDLPCCGVRIEVRGGVVVSRTLRSNGQTLEPGFEAEFPRLDALFDVIIDAIPREPVVLDVGFNGVFGFPTGILIDDDPAVPGRESYTVMEFREIQ